MPLVVKVERAPCNKRKSAPLVVKGSVPRMAKGEHAASTQAGGARNPLIIEPGYRTRQARIAFITLIISSGWNLTPHRMQHKARSEVNGTHISRSTRWASSFLGLTRVHPPAQPRAGPPFARL